ncbi:hypothetical protein BSKO_09413 [Bryopsis sp. KO-2023]|nr:hypothetical protein BSKO_09413 [Bryopsis sp. KO-2023]
MTSPSLCGVDRPGRKTVECPQTDSSNGHGMASTPDGRNAPCAKISLVRTALSSLRDLWGNQPLSDITVTLRVGNQPERRYPLHRTVLCSSGYFKSLIQGDWGRCEGGELCPDDPLFDVDAFEAVVRGLYGFEVDVSKSNVLNLLAVGAYLHVEEICEDCKTFLVEELDRMSMADVAQCFATVSCREYPGSVDIKSKSLGLLAVHAWDEARDVLLTLPASVLEELLCSNNLWVPDEAGRVDLVLDLLERTKDMDEPSPGAGGASNLSEMSREDTDSCPALDPSNPAEFEDPVNSSGASSVIDASNNACDDDVQEGGGASSSIEIPSPGCFPFWGRSNSTGPTSQRDALLRVLRKGIHYAFIPDSQLCTVQAKLKKLGDKQTIASMETHFWTRGMFYGVLQGVDEAAGTGGESKSSRDQPWRKSWLRFGIEFSDVEQMAAKQQQDSNKIYYAGFLWWVKLRFRERDENDDMYNAYVCVCNCKPVEGPYIDKGGVGTVDVDATIKDKCLCLGDFRFNTSRFAWGDGRGWAVFKRSNLQSLMTKSGTIRVAVALRVVV